MKIICAPASFKETLSAQDAARAMTRGIERADRGASVDTCPVGDGGEGTMEALVHTMRGELLNATVTGPLGEPVAASFGVVRESRSDSSRYSPAIARDIEFPLGIVELAQASGLALVPRALRNPMRTTTFGTGELIRAAMKHGCRSVIVCIGGSATIDGGTGIAQALGAKFFDARGNLMTKPMCGGDLQRIARIDPPAELPMILVACDVTNPLCGPSGAAAIYGPQKGATPAQVQDLDRGLQHLANLLHHDPNIPGAGAAGGAGYGLLAMGNAALERGIELVLRVINFESRCEDAALVLTGEGRLDRQSLFGKACMGVAKAAAQHGVPTIAIVGSTGEGADDCVNPQKGGLLKSYFSLTERFGLNRSRHDPARLIEDVAYEITQGL